MTWHYADHYEEKDLWLCHECDLIIKPCITHRYKAILCPRCNCEVANTVPVNVTSGLAFVLTGIILYLPAVSLPVMSVELLGNTHATSVIGSVMNLYNSGFLLVATLVLLLVLVIPALRLCALLILLLGMKGWRLSEYLFLTTLKLYQQILAWRIFDIYLLGIFVTFVKLDDMASVEVNFLGLFCFTSVMLIELVLIKSLNIQTIWHWALRRWENGYRS